MRLPWWGKIAAKLLLSRLPVSYATWARLGAFRHGEMDRPQRALDSFLIHARTAGLVTTDTEPPRLAVNGLRVLEIGPGDSAFTALVAHALGAAQAWLVDAGAFATTDPVAYAELAAFLSARGYATVEQAGEPTGAMRETGRAEPAPGLDGWLAHANARYLTQGTASLAEIPDAGVDFIFSNAVLEHIPLDEVPQLARETARLLAPGGVAVHRVDLQDHLGGALNNLRFSHALWESRWFRGSGFYTNRLRQSEFVAAFAAAGLVCELPRVIRWDTLPTPRAALAPRFRAWQDDELRVMGFDLVLRHAGQG